MIPKSFKLGAETIIVRQKDFINSGNILGEYSKGIGCVDLALNALSEKIPYSSKERTFFHELVHAMLYHIGERDLSSNEQFVDALSGVMHQYVSENYNLIVDGIQE